MRPDARLDVRSADPLSLSLLIAEFIIRVSRDIMSKGIAIAIEDIFRHWRYGVLWDMRLSEDF
jgi:hypothetical protein